MSIFLFSHTILLWSLTVRIFMYETILLKIMHNSWFAYSPPLSDRKILNLAENWFLIIAWNAKNTLNTSCLCFIVYSHVILVQASTNVTYQHMPWVVIMGDDPQTSEWIKVNGPLLLLLIGKDTRWLCANIHVLRLKDEQAISRNNLGNRCFI